MHGLSSCENSKTTKHINPWVCLKIIMENFVILFVILLVNSHASEFLRLFKYMVSGNDMRRTNIKSFHADFVFSGRRQTRKICRRQINMIYARFLEIQPWKLCRFNKGFQTSYLVIPPCVFLKFSCILAYFCMYKLFSNVVFVSSLNRFILYFSS